MERPTSAEQPIQFEDEPPEEVVRPAASAVAGEDVEVGPKGFPASKDGGAPAWFVMPDGLKVPRGRMIMFFRFPARWTDTPHKGMQISGEEGLWRQCLCWVISPVDKKLGYERCRGDQLRVIEELTKAMVRVVDGHVADWSGTAGASTGGTEGWWGEIGERCRSRLISAYLKMHALDEEEMRYFFESCVEVRNAG